MIEMLVMLSVEKLAITCKGDICIYPRNFFCCAYFLGNIICGEALLVGDGYIIFVVEGCDSMFGACPIGFCSMSFYAKYGVQPDFDREY